MLMSPCYFSSRYNFGILLPLVMQNSWRDVAKWSWGFKQYQVHSTHLFQVCSVVFQLQILAGAAKQMIQNTLFGMHPFIKAVIHATPEPQREKITEHIIEMFKSAREGSRRKFSSLLFAGRRIFGVEVYTSSSCKIKNHCLKGRSKFNSNSSDIIKLQAWKKEPGFLSAIQHQGQLTLYMDPESDNHQS